MGANIYEQLAECAQSVCILCVRATLRHNNIAKLQHNLYTAIFTMIGQHKMTIACNDEVRPHTSVAIDD